MLLAANWPALMADRRHATVRRILERLPADRGVLGPFCEALDVVCQIYEGVDQRITAERAEALAADHGDNPAVRPLIDAALISPFYGQIGRVAELAREAWQRYADIPEIQTQLVGPAALVLWFAGEYEEVRRLLEPRVGLTQPAYVRIWTLAILSITAAEQGDAEQAEQFGRQAMAEVEATGGETAIEFAGAAWVLGEALRQRGKLEEARRYVDLGLANEARRPGSVSQANALIYDAKLALAEDDRPRARASVRRAREIVAQYDDLGTTSAKLDRIDAALDSPSANPLLGSKPTPAELQVLQLLDSDRTFAAIADELYLSRETVKSHARRLYRRLGERTRAGAVAAARERGLLSAE
jgi:DNA-binding NarL/FixJ family response regulator